MRLFPDQSSIDILSSMMMMVILWLFIEELVVILSSTSMNFPHHHSKSTKPVNMDKGTVWVPRKPALQVIQTRNVLSRPASSQEKNKQQNLDLVRVLMNLTAFAKTRPTSMASMAQQQGETSRTNRKHPGFKYNRIKMATGTNRFPRSTADYKQSLYEKSLKRTKSIRQRRDFQDSVRQISCKPYLTTKRSILSGQSDSHRRHKSQLQHPPQSATIIIELKRMFNNRVGYNFVQNHYTQPQEIKRDEQIFSTTHTNNQAERSISYTHSLQRTQSAKRDSSSSKNRVKKSLTTENQLIPWPKQTQRMLTEHQFGFTEIFCPQPSI